MELRKERKDENRIIRMYHDKEKEQYYICEVINGNVTKGVYSIRFKSANTTYNNL